MILWMNFRALVGFVVLAVGCGGPDFSGTFVGSLARSGSCSDGSGIPASTIQVDWSVKDSGDEIQITPVAGNCSPLVATGSGGVATFRQKTCPATTINGVTSTETLTGGSLSLNDSSLTVTMNSNIQFSGALVGTCAAVATGTLSRR